MVAGFKRQCSSRMVLHLPAFLSLACSSLCWSGFGFSITGVEPLGVVTLGVVIGRISVFSSLFFFGLGSGAVTL